MRRLAQVGTVVVAGIVVGALAVVAVRPAEAGPSQSVTIGASQPIVPAFGTIVLSGAVSSGREHESVTIQQKDCGVPGASFRNVLVVETRAQGFRSTEFYPNVSALVRAAWGDVTSAPISVRQVPRIFLRRLPGGRFEIAISATLSFWGKQAVFQQRVSGSWRKVKRVVLGKQWGAGTQVWTAGRFRAAVPRGRPVRAVLPAAQARPCYAPGVSNHMRA